MKKPLALFVGACLLFTSLTGCSGSTDTQDTLSEPTQSYHIVATNFSVYDWTTTLLAGTDAFSVSYLLDSGVDSHSYQPTADDIIEIAQCDLFIYIGGESDTWVDGVLAQSTNDDMIVLNLMEILGDATRAEQTVEGMEVSDHEEEHAHDDEHIWLSLRNAQALSNQIATQLMALDSANADTYASNLDAYLTTLADLDGQYAAAVEAATTNTILVADRFPLLYLVSDYGIDYYAAFNGCSAETEASFETIAFLANKVDELGLNTIFTIENPQHQIAQTVVATATTQTPNILVLNSMQSVSADDMATGITYYDTMVENLAALVEALG